MPASVLPSSATRVWAATHCVLALNLVGCSNLIFKFLKVITTGCRMEHGLARTSRGRVQIYGLVIKLVGARGAPHPPSHRFMFGTRKQAALFLQLACNMGGVAVQNANAKPKQSRLSFLKCRRVSGGRSNLHDERKSR